jgi:hypothetical protein
MCRGPSTAVAIEGIDIDGRKGAVAGIDTEQSGSILTEVVVVLHLLQLVLEGAIIAGGGIRHGIPNRGRLALTTSSSSTTVPQRQARSPGHVYARGGRLSIRRRPAKVQNETKTSETADQRSDWIVLGLGLGFFDLPTGAR